MSGKQNKMIIMALATGLAASLLSSANVAAATFNVLQDTTIYDSGNVNGTGQGMFVGRSSDGSIKRGLIEFDLSSITAGAVVTSASLTMHVNRDSSGLLETVAMHAVSQSWNAGTSGTGGASKGGGGGVPASPGDATWTSSGNAAWPAGGAFEPAVTASIQVAGTGFYTFSGGSLVSDIQGWIDNPGMNFGWILIGNEFVNSTAKRFSSSENTGAGGANVPVLTVEFQATVVPVPAAVWLMGSGMLMLLGMGRRYRCQGAASIPA